jgi:RNA polymerase sigma-70 factor, ECF subfamily
MSDETEKSDQMDQELVNLALQGDERAFEKLVDKYKKRVYYLAYRMTRDHDSADELAQESFVKAYRALGSFKAGYNFYTWIYRICVNLSINFLKREKHTISVELLREMDLLPEGRSELDQLERMIASEQAGIVRRAIETLPPEQKSAFILKTYENMSYEQMAEVMECSIGTVMSRLFRARQKLRRALKATETESDGFDDRL